MKTRTLTHAMAALTSLCALGALAPSTASAQTACYVPGSGTVYRIKEPNTPTQCSTGHVEFQLSAAAKPGGGGASGAAGGDLGGSYPNPSVVKIQGQPISTNVPSAGQVLTFAAGAWTPQTPSAAALPVNAAGAYDFSNVSGLVATSTSTLANIPAMGAGRRLEWIAKYGAFRAGEVDGAQWDEVNIGSRSAALGFNNIASGIASFAAGTGNSATSTGSIALGVGNSSTVYGAFAAGLNSAASSTAAIALGQAATASGPQSIALGVQALASGSGAVSIGNHSTAVGSNAFAIGNLTVADGANSTAMGNHASTSGTAGSFVYGDGSSSSTIGALLDNSFVVRAQHFWLGTTSTPTATAGRLLETSTGAYLSAGGTWTNTSDVHKKHAFKLVDGEDLLGRIEAMPVSTWTYNTESDSVRHMGPTAQDFRKAFGLGDTDKAIATVDADGVSLAAVKALLQRTKTLSSESSALRQRTTALSKENDGLRQRTTILSKENGELRGMINDLAQRLQQLEQARR